MGDQFYINASINNPGLGNVLDKKPARYNVSFNQALIDKADDYYMAVVKFQIPLQGLPLFIFPIKPNQANANLSPLSIGVCETENPATIPSPPLTTGFDSPVIWIPQQYSQPVPTQNQTYQVVTPYYYCYSYAHFVYVTNQALLTAWTAAGSPGGAGKNPYFEYDSTSQSINLVAPYEFVNAASATGFGWRVYVNDYASYFFQAFDYDINHGRFEISTHSLATNNSYIASYPYSTRIENKPAGDITISEPNRGAGTTYLIKSEYRSNDYINSVRKLVFTSNQLPITKEYFPSANQSQSGDPSYLGVITDFNLDVNNEAGSQRSVALYDADIYRMIDLISPVPIRTIDIQIYWADSLNNLYPVEIGNLDSVNIKLGFFSKEVYNSDGSLK